MTLYSFLKIVHIFVKIFSKLSAEDLFLVGKGEMNHRLNIVPHIDKMSFVFHGIYCVYLLTLNGPFVSAITNNFGIVALLLTLQSEK